MFLTQWRKRVEILPICNVFSASWRSRLSLILHKSSTCWQFKKKLKASVSPPAASVAPPAQYANIMDGVVGKANEIFDVMKQFPQFIELREGTPICRVHTKTLSLLRNKKNKPFRHTIDHFIVHFICKDIVRPCPVCNGPPVLDHFQNSSSCISVMTNFLTAMRVI